MDDDDDYRIGSFLDTLCVSISVDLTMHGMDRELLYVVALVQVRDIQDHPLPVLNCVYKKIKDHHDDDSIYIYTNDGCDICACMLHTNPIIMATPMGHPRYLVCPIHNDTGGGLVL